MENTALVTDLACIVVCLDKYFCLNVPYFTCKSFEPHENWTAFHGE